MSSRSANRAGRDEGDPAAVGGPPVSVVITVLNEGPALTSVVGDVVAQLRGGDELVLVDGGSTDGSLEALPSHPAVRLDVVPGAGISAGRNHRGPGGRHEGILGTDAGL